MNDEQYAKLREEMAANETEHKSFRRRLEEHDEAIKEQREILIILERQSSAIERMNGSITRIETAMVSMDRRMDEIEKEPADKWKKISFEVVKYVILAAVGVAVGFILKGGV